jgi:transcriptional regulator with XRE-family HTH domain
MGNSEKHKTGNRLREIAKQMYDGNQSDLARALGMKPPSFSKYVQGNRRPGAAVLKRLTLLGVNLHWFLTGEGSVTRSSSAPAQPLPVVAAPAPSQLDGPDGTLHRVPLVQITTNAEGHPQLEEVGNTAKWLDESFIRQAYGVSPDQLKGFRISGDAMTEQIHPGDRVRGALWQGESLVDGAIYLFHGLNGVIARRVRTTDTTLVLTANNPDVPDLSFDACSWTDRLRPIARLLEVTRPL